MTASEGVTTASPSEIFAVHAKDLRRKTGLTRRSPRWQDSVWFQTSALLQAVRRMGCRKSPVCTLQFGERGPRVLHPIQEVLTAGMHSGSYGCVMLESETAHCVQALWMAERSTLGFMPALIALVSQEVREATRWLLQFTVAPAVQRHQIYNGPPRCPVQRKPAQQAIDDACAEPGAADLKPMPSTLHCDARCPAAHVSPVLWRASHTDCSAAPPLLAEGLQ